MVLWVGINTEETGGILWFLTEKQACKSKNTFPQLFTIDLSGQACASVSTLSRYCRPKASCVEHSLVVGV